MTVTFMTRTRAGVPCSKAERESVFGAPAVIPDGMLALSRGGATRRRDNCVMNPPIGAPVAPAGEPVSPAASGSAAGPSSLQFSSVGLAPVLQRAVADQGYTTMTPIQ